VAGAPPIALIVVAIISVQGGSALAATLVRSHPASTVVALRLLLSAVVLGVARRPSGRGRSARAVGWAIVLGLVLAAMNSLFYLAIARIPLGVVVTIEFWGPLAVAVAGSRRAVDLLWVVVAAIGIWALGGARLAADDAIGVGLALAAGGGWALFILVGGRVAREWPGGRGLAISTGVAAAVAVPIAIQGGAIRELAGDPGFLLAAAGVALFASIIPWTLELTAMRRVASATYGILMSLEPAVAAIFGTVLLGQGLAPGDAGAIGMVVAASVGASRTSRRGPIPGELET
jgi:inner membrane transporter RhtA